MHYYLPDTNPNVAFYMFKWWDKTLQNYDYDEFISSINNEKRKKVVFIEYDLIETLFTISPKNFSWADLIVFSSDEEGLDSEYKNSFNDKNPNLNATINSVRNFFSNDNIIFVNGSYFYDYEEPLNKIIAPPFLRDFYHTHAANQHLVEYYTKINQQVSKKFTFDCLLGSDRIHRKMLFDYLKNKNLLKKSLVFINGKTGKYESPELFDMEDERIKLHKLNPFWMSGDFIEDINTPMSALISPKIYENSYYSIVAESLFTYNGINRNYATEKTAKCFFAKRIFVCFALPNHLKFLKKLGFKTFNGIIDERYDEEYSNAKRFKMVCEQIQWLIKQDPIFLYQQAEDILNHNFNLVNQKEFGLDKITKFIQPYIDKL